MSYAGRIAGDVLVERVEVPEGLSLADLFHPDLGFEPVPDAAAVGMVRGADGAFAPAPPPAPPPVDPVAHLAAKRYAVEVAGVRATIGGASVVVSTARDMRDGMRDTMLAIVVGLRKDGAALKVFADGVPRPASNAEAEAAISAAFGHVQAAFDVEAGLYPHAAAGAIGPAEIDAAPWPPLPD